MKMSRMKKLLFTSALLLGTGGMLTACGSSNGQEKNGQTEIRFSWWGGDTRHEATLNAIKIFEKENPDIKVKSEYSGYDGIVEKMTTQIASGTSPDLMQINYDWLVNYSPTGEGFYDLSKLTEVDLSGYSDEFLATGEVNGIQNAVPLTPNAYTIMVNKTQYDEKNIEIPKTWDDLFKAAEKFGEGEYPLYTSPYTGFILASQYLQQKDGDIFITKEGELGFTQKQIEEVLDFYAEMVDKGVIPTVKESVGELSGAASLSESPAFLEGKYAGVHEWSTQAGMYETALKNANNQELAFLGLPTLEGSVDTGVSTKPAFLFAVSKTTKHPKETAKLLNFLLNDEDAIKEIGLERGVPANKKASNILEENGIITGVTKTANDYINTNMSDIPLSPYFEASKVSEAWAPLMDSYAYGELSAKDTAKQMYDGINEALKELKE